MQALLVIDMQAAFLDKKWGERNNPFAEQNILKVLSDFRQKNKPVIHIHHISTDTLSPFYVEAGQAPLVGFAPLSDEKVCFKCVNSGFIGTDLEQYLRKQGIKDLVIVGLTLPHCVSTTTRMAANLGFNVLLLSDATASFSLSMPNGEMVSAEEIHKVNIATLNQEFAQISSTEAFLAG